MPRVSAKGLWAGLSDGTKLNTSQWATGGHPKLVRKLAASGAVNSSTALAS
jgi:hypothetical protein